jgi:hypothetical protein
LLEQFISDLASQAQKLEDVDCIFTTDILRMELASIYSTSHFPALAARHLLDGFPIEMIDSDACRLNDAWFKS